MGKGCTICVGKGVGLYLSSCCHSLGQLLSPFPAAYVHEQLARYPHVKGKASCAMCTVLFLITSNDLSFANT